mmetsp:Transcript_14588/g.49386  ORF Transcript_14588/g.49386 Transcript_14588/m.49386 type:complete len:213 (-) Transcript_14588:221-859(-)
MPPSPPSLGTACWRRLCTATSARRGPRGSAWCTPGPRTARCTSSTCTPGSSSTASPSTAPPCAPSRGTRTARSSSLPPSMAPWPSGRMRTREGGSHGPTGRAWRARASARPRTPWSAKCARRRPAGAPLRAARALRSATQRTRTCTRTATTATRRPRRRPSRTAPRRRARARGTRRSSRRRALGRAGHERAPRAGGAPTCLPSPRSWGEAAR